MKEDYKGYTVEVYVDEDPMNPRDYDNLSTIGTWHTRYNIGDFKIGKPAKAIDFPGYTGKKEYLMDSLEVIEGFMESQGWSFKPLYLYDHSGITVSLTPFGCKWDSGQVGYVYLRNEELRRQMGWNRVTEKRLEHAWKNVELEIEELDRYLRGDLYCFFIEDAPEGLVDYCSGYLSEEEALEEVKACVDSYLHYKDTVDNEKEYQ